MHDKDTKSLTTRITSSGNFTISNSTEMVTQIAFNCSNNGTGNWVLRVQDKAANAHTWVGPLTLAGPSGGPSLLNYNSPIRFTDGILINTSGNAGVLDLSVSVLNTQGL